MTNKNTDARVELADHISAIFSNPETPDEIYNALVGELIELTDSAQANIRTPEVLRVVLPIALEVKAQASDKQQNEAAAQESEQAEGVATEVSEQAEDATAPPDADPCHPLFRIQKALKQPLRFRRVTWERAEQIVDRIIDQDADEQAHAFIELLEGITHAMFKTHMNEAESIMLAASRRAYFKTMHSHDSFNEFAALDPTNANDLRVLQREFEETEN